MAINTTLHIDDECDALHRPTKMDDMTKVSGMKRLLKGETKSRFVKIRNLSCENIMRFEHEDMKTMQEKLHKLEGENKRLRTQVATMNLREAAMKERVKEVEFQLQELQIRVVDAEKLVSDLQENTLSSSQGINANDLQIVCHKDDEKRELQELVERLQLLCVNHDGTAYANNFNAMERMEHQGHKRIQRSTSAYKAPPPTNETKLLCWGDNQIVEYVNHDVEQVVELQEEVNMLSTKSKFYDSQRQAMKKVVAASKAKLAEVTAENQTLKKELYIERRLMQAREDDVQNLETHVEALSTSNHMLKSMLNLKKMALETRKSFNFIILEPTLLDLAATVSTQNACVVRLSVQNENLARSLSLRIQENEHQHDQVATAIKRKDAAIRALEQFKQQMVEWATEMDERTSNYEMLQEHVTSLEADLRNCRSELTVMQQTYKEVMQERDQLFAWQAHARSRLTDLENTVDEREKEAESFSREALHMSLEVELLRRKLLQLDEDVMLKEGQISILRSGWEGE